MSEERQVPLLMSAEEYANAPTYARDLIDKLALVMEQRDELIHSALGGALPSTLNQWPSNPTNAPSKPRTNQPAPTPPSGTGTAHTRSPPLR